MWDIRLTGMNFEADVRELLMAFYPEGEDVIVEGKCETDRCHMDLIYGSGEKLAIDCILPKNRFDAKCELKKSLYKAISAKEQRTLPWGTLTGIRPTKLAMQGLDFKNTFLASEEKIKLCFDTAAREAKVLEKTDNDTGWSLYIGIPFCPSKCLYCSFTSYPIGLWKEGKKAYISALCKEIEAVSQIMSGHKLQTIYMGGGTPTSLEAEDLATIMEQVRNCNDLSHLLEYTVEAGRPDSITAEKLTAIKQWGADRISINPQTMNQRTLDLIGRRHTVDDVKEKFALARSLGFDNINMDLIMGLPGEHLDDVVRTMDEIEKLHPDDVTVHSLALKRGARLNEEKDKYDSVTYEEMCEMIALSHKRCMSMGLKPYYMYRQKNMAGNFENVGFSGDGKEGIYNILIMEEKQKIVGCGAGCTTKLPLPDDRGVKRIENVKDPQVYIERIDEMIGRKRDINNGTY